MTTAAKKVVRLAPGQVGRMVESVIGCKWSMTVLGLVARGVVRPGELERCIEGLSAKVLNYCLRRLVEFSILEKHSFPEVPPRVEYTLTNFGRKFTRVLEDIDALEDDYRASMRERRPQPEAVAPHRR